MKRKKRIILIAVIALIIAAAVTVVMARYIASQRKAAYMTSEKFHISSNYLKEDGAEWTVSDWGSGFDIEINNYEVDNLANIAEVDMVYTVSVSDGWLYSEDGTTSTSYTLPTSAERTTQTLHVAPRNSTTGGDVTVTVTTTSPYKKTLSATFHVVGKKTPDYTIEDQGDGSVLITIHTNDYAGTETIKWDAAKYSPDNTNETIRTFYDSNIGTDGLSYGTIDVASNSTYSFLFFTTSGSDLEGTGTTITLK